jgi:BMFP domain-containing protein YqiC
VAVPEATRKILERLHNRIAALERRLPAPPPKA